METILLIDDHTMFREGLLLALAQQAPHLSITAVSGSHEAIAALDARPEIGLVVMDYYLPDVGGSALVQRLRQSRPGMRMLVLSASEDPDDMHAALAAGAHGFLQKSADCRALLGAMACVMRGERYVPAGFESGEPDTAQTDDAAALSTLTPRQLEVLRLVCEGLRNNEISERLGTSEKTIKAHMSAILSSLGVINRTQAVLAARRGGLLGKPR